MLGKQASKGSTATPNIAIAYLDDGFSTNMQINNLKSGGDNEYHLDNIKMEHREAFSFSVNARPDIISYLSAYILGTDTLSGTNDPYTHTITRNERAWLTMERMLTATVSQRLTDCKIENLTISGEAGTPLKISVDGQGLTAIIRTSALSPVIDTAEPIMFYDGQGRFKIDTTIDNNIKSFEIKINVNSGGGLRDDQYKLEDLPDFNYSVSCSAELNTTNFTRFKKINYNASTTPQEGIATGALEIDCLQILTTTRQLKINIPYLMWEPITGIILNPNGSTVTETVAGVAMKQGTTELMTITCQNSLNEDGIQDNEDDLIQDNNGQIIQGVY